jgi:aryl-phospho-beta-D-glucosidase BglC (GH1 family)
MNKYFRIILCALFVLMSTPTAFAAVNDDLMLYYSFDTDEGATVTDLSGNNHTAAVNGATHTLNGIQGGAYHFDGDDTIIAGNLGSYPVGTISFWINADVVEDFRNPFSTDYAGWDDNIRFEIDSTGEFVGGGHGLGRGGEYARVLDSKKWYHVVYAWDENYVYGYLNGSLKFKNPHPDPNSFVHPNITDKTAGEFKDITLNFTNVAIGNGYSIDPERFWKGLVDEVRIYSRPLTPGEVIELYELKDTGLIVHYTFDEAPDAQNKVQDLSGSNHDGISVGGMNLIADGVLGGAYEFDGNTGRVMAGNMGHLQEGTVSFWAKTRDFPFIQFPNAFTSRFNGGDNSVRFELDEQGNFFIGGNPFIPASGQLTDSFNPDQWYFLSLTWDSNGAKVYFNGEEKASLPGSLLFNKNFSDVAIGTGYFDDAFRYWEGSIDDFRLYNRRLSLQEIQGIYNAATLGIVYQNFEPNNGTPPSANPAYCFGINSASATASTDQSFLSTQSCKITSTNPFGGAGFPAQTQTYHVNFDAARHDRLTFWIWANPSNNSANDVRVRFFDHDTYKDTGNPFDGVEIFSARRIPPQQWTQVTILLTQLPSDFDFSDVDKINIVNEFTGTYYIDDIHVASADRIYQSFEPGNCHALNSDCGWTWDGAVSVQNQNVHEGVNAWQLTTNSNNWSGTGIASQEKGFDSHFHVDLNPVHLATPAYDKLSFWIRQSAQNGMNNNLNVQFFDQQSYKTNHFPFWTVQTAVEGKWKRITVPFSHLPADFNITDIDKIQFQFFWPGTYLLDDIRASKSPILTINPAYVASGIVTWDHFAGAAQYTLQESIAGSDGPWQTIYQGTENNFISQNLTSSWLRVRWETESDGNKKLVPYYSDWSNPILYEPSPVLIKHNRLQQGNIEWSFIPQASTYEIQEADTKNGFWTTIYQGGYTINPIPSTVGKWYRARAIKLDENQNSESATGWSPALQYDSLNFIAAAGTSLREANGQGEEVILRGVNLGNSLLIEPWMFFGSNHPYTTLFPDDANIRQALLEREDIEQSDIDELFKIYQQAYLTEDDFNNIFRMNGNVVRLPILYRNIRELDENGQWAGNGFNFDAIDRIIKFCADRGIYVLLDLHGAPGSQSKEFHTGRTSAPTPFDGFYHQLFNPNTDTYRQRTVELWVELVNRYGNSPVVVGYDILNEPFGAIDPFYYANHNDGYLALWSLYDRIYDAIRAIDPNHLIVMEGIPLPNDWESLPDPNNFGWTNIAYELHYYGFTFNENGEINGTLDPAGHVAYLNNKITNSRQNDYQVPVLLGEFNGFNQRANWNYYCQVLRNQGWSWTMWSYKTRDFPSEWGIYNYSQYTDEPPQFHYEDIHTLKQKLSKYDTLTHHTANESIHELTSDAFDACPALPELTTSISVTITPQGAINAGAQWRLTSGPDTSWKNSGDVISNLFPGQYIIRFKNITGWQRPAQQTIQLDAFSNLQRQGTYIQNPEGFVTAAIQPQAAINAGAQWRLTTGADTNWKNSGEILTVPAGNYTIAFKKIRRFTKPANKHITVIGGQTISVVGTYH